VKLDPESYIDYHRQIEIYDKVTDEFVAEFVLPPIHISYIRSRLKIDSTVDPNAIFCYEIHEDLITELFNKHIIDSKFIDSDHVWFLTTRS
jgi:hypothetical protein